MDKRYVKIGVLASLILFSLPFDLKNNMWSLANFIHLSKSNDPVDGGWLADLTGLPGPQEINQLTDLVEKAMKEEQDHECLSINPHLRKMYFQHFVIYQHMANAQHIYFNKNIAHHWAHLLAMILKESSGDTTNVTSMTGKSFATYTSKTDLTNWEQIVDLSNKSRIPLNPQTNFGLTQISADRLFVALNLARDKRYNTGFLEGIEGASSLDKIRLNTAIAVRRLIWFYQDFAQGRIKQSDWRIPPYKIHSPEFAKRYQNGLKLALLYCGTNLMFRDEPSKNPQIKLSRLENAMASIAYCKLGNAQSGYGVTEVDDKCFADWVTLCPALNIDIADITPLRYFATRYANPVCETTLQHLIKSK